MKLLRSLLWVALLCGWLPRSQAQHRFISNIQRLRLIDSLQNTLQGLRQQSPSFGRDTALFYTLDRYDYEYFEINRPFSEKQKKMVFFPDSMYQIAQRRHWPAGLAIGTVRRARAISWLGDKAAAVTLYKQGIRLCEQQKLYREQSEALIGLAVCFAYRKNMTRADWETAVGYMKQGLQVAQRHQDIENIHRYYNLMGDFHVIRNQYVQALTYYKAERPLMRQHPYLIGYRTNTAYLGICYLHTNQEKKAWNYLNEFFAINKLNEGAYATYLYHTVLSEISRYYLLNRKNYQKALTYQVEYERILQERPLFDQSIHYETMTKIYAGLKNYEKAFQYQQLYLIARDSLKLEDTEKKFTQIEHQLDLQRKENQIKSLQNSSLKQTNKTQASGLLFLGITFLLLVGVMGLVIYSIRLKKEAIESELQLASERKEINTRIHQTQEIERQRIAADLHDDLGGTLATIRRKIADGQLRFRHTEAHQTFDELDPLIQKSSADLRRIAHNLMPPEFARLGLSSAVDQFIQSIPLKPTRIEFLTSGQERKLPIDIELNLYRIILELIQNSLKHAQANRASVQLLYYDDRLCVEVEDNGIGIDARKLEESEGIGLKNSILRADYMGATLRRETSDGGTFVLVELPYSSIHAIPKSGHYSAGGRPSAI